MVAQVVNAAVPGGVPVVTSLHVANLDANVTDSQLYNLFSQIGDVVSVRLCRNPLGYGFVDYANPQCAQRALEELNFTPLNGKPIEITCSRKQPSMCKTGIRSIYIGNLDKKIDHKDIHEIFSPFGNILSCKVAKDASGQPMGYGFVQFAGEESAQKAIAELNSMLLNGKQIYVGYYLSKQERALLADKAHLTSVFVNNFCESTTEGDLKNIFGEFGLITSTVVMRNEDGTSRCFGFVNFANSNDAARAVESLSSQIFNEKKWYVGRSQKKSERQLELKHQVECVNEAFDKGSNLYVKNLDDSIDNENLKELFSPFGLVTSCRVIRDNKGKNTGKGYVAYSSPEEASRALCVMNGVILGSKPLYVALARRKEDRRAGVENLDTENHKSFLETFSSIGNIVPCKVATDVSGQSMGCGFVQFAGEESKDKATEEHSGMPLNEKQVHVGPFLSKQEKELSTEKSNFTNVFVKNIRESTTEDEVKARPETFSSIGNIVSCKVATDASGQSMGCDCVQFAGEKSKDKATEEHNGMPLNEKQVSVGPFLSKQEKELSIEKANFTNVFVKNFRESTTEDELKNIFGEFGVVTSTVVMRNEDGTSKCFGFVSCEKADDAARAVESLNDQKFDNKKWYVEGAHKEFERQLELHLTHYLEQQRVQHVKEAVDKGSNIHVKNLDQSIGDAELKEMFLPFGSVTSCWVMRNKHGMSKRRGFVAFSSSEAASRAISEMNGKILGSKTLYVALAQRKEDRIAQLQNLDKDHKALHETFSSSCKVSTDASSQSIGYGHTQFSGVESDQKAIAELNGIIGELKGMVRKLNGVIGEFIGIIGGFNNIFGGLNGMLMNRKQVCAGPFLNKQEKKLLVYKANNTNVFVENFCESTSEDDLKKIFGEFGLLTSTVVMRNEDGTSKCFGFVNFENAEDASRAVESLNGEKFDRKEWCSRRAQKRQRVKEAVDKGSSLYVNNLDDSTDNKKLTELFSPFGSVTSCKVMRDQKVKRIRLGKRQKQLVKEAIDKGSNLSVNNLNASIGDKELKKLFSPFGSVRSCKVMRNRKGISKGSGLVAYSSPEEASRAISEMNGKILFSKPLYVALSQRKEGVRAQLQNLDKEIDHKALPGSFLSSQDVLSRKVATDASGRSKGYGCVLFSGEEYAQKAIEEHNGLPLNEEQVCVESLLSEQEKDLPIEKANFTYVFVKNFCKSTTEDKLKNTFCEFGAIASTIVMRYEDGTSKCFGFVSFEKAEDAARAVESLNGQKFDNKKWYVGRAEKEFKRELELKNHPEQCAKYPFNEGSNIYVNNLNDNSSSKKLSEVFSPFRPVKSCKVMQDKKGISRGSGLVALSPPVGVSRALSEMNGKILVSKPHCAAALAQRKEDRRVRLQLNLYGQPGFAYQELLVPGIRPAQPLMPNMVVPLVQQQHGLCTVGRPTNAYPKEKGPQPASAMSQQMFPRGCRYCYPLGKSQSIPVGPLATSLANASQLGRGRCLVKFCTLLLNNWSPRKQIK